jgi:membrane protein YdbS with pleckstrin-like domain
MNDFQEMIFLVLIIVIIIGIIAIKFVYDLWATSVTYNLLKNNSGALSGKRVIIWLAVIGIIALILGFLGKRQQERRQY